MIISKIERQKKDKQRYSLFVDDQFLLGIDEAVLIHFSLHKGQEVSEELLAEIREAEYHQKVYSKAIHYISYGLRTIKEMRDYLAKIPALNEEELRSETGKEGLGEVATIDDSLISDIIERLLGQQYLNDLVYGQSYVRTSALINRKGPSTIYQELIRKGLTEQEILQALEEYPMDQQIENIQHLAQKYIRTKKNVPFKMLKNKLFEHLLIKGFDSDLIKQEMDQLDFDYSQDHQDDLLNKTAEKLVRTRQKKYSGYDLRNKVKEGLYRKGFDFEAINYWLEDHAELWEKSGK
ncbi:RecX family transcriptional regulator [Fundicoccus sp. Sow4_F4]|uniref:RecX family transcriptional regulator n=1 Tax=Fundicoccus sp. Sow4_F4 TaxID=3438783 RepID=UPI003F8F605C